MTPDSQQCWAVIPATGVGSRMKTERPKQYLPLGDKTILEHTLDNLLAYPQIDGAMLILHQADDFWHQLNYTSDKPLLLCHGGAERHHSVLNGLTALRSQINDDSVVMIHDAVRPFVLYQDLDSLLQQVVVNADGALLATPLADTLKQARPDQSVQNTQPRDHLWRALTPQAFRLGRIYAALHTVIENHVQVTDDSSAMEYCGYHPRLVCADIRNIKITYPEDLRMAELILSSSLNR